jgi:hypothetical protein
MSNAQRCWWLTVAVVALSVAGPPAYAFNPQPDPPAKLKLNSSDFNSFKNDSFKNDKIGTKNAVSPGPCNPGVSCGAIDSFKGSKKYK